MSPSDGSQTEVYAIGEFPSIITALQSIADDIENWFRGLCTGVAPERPFRQPRPGRQKCKENQ